MRTSVVVIVIAAIAGGANCYFCQSLDTGRPDRAKNSFCLKGLRSVTLVRLRKHLVRLAGENRVSRVCPPDGDSRRAMFPGVSSQPHGPDWPALPGFADTPIGGFLSAMRTTRSSISADFSR